MDKCKRKKQLMALVFSIAFFAYAKPFTEYSVVINSGVSIMTTVQSDAAVTKPAFTTGFDIVLKNQSGFSMLITHNAHWLKETSSQPITISSLSPFPMINLLFGYTYRINAAFEYSIAAGLGCGFFPDAHINIPIQNSISVYFTKQYGLSFSLLEQCSCPLKNQGSFINGAKIGLGAVFRF